MLKLRILVSGLHIIGTDSFRYLALMSSNPVALVTLMLLLNKRFSYNGDTKFGSLL